MVTVKLLRTRGMPILRQLQFEEALLRATTDNWFLINDGCLTPAIVIGISGCDVPSFAACCLMRMNWWRQATQDVEQASETSLTPNAVQKTSRASPRRSGQRRGDPGRKALQRRRHRRCRQPDAVCNSHHAERRPSRRRLLSSADNGVDQPLL